MKTVVLDASVVVKLFFEEKDSKAAEQCVAQAEELLAPDLVWVETANVIWKRQRRGNLTADAASDIARSILALPVVTHPAADLVPDALELAMQLDRTVYDCLYLALAVKTKSVMITGDKRLVSALAGGPLAKHVVWIGERLAE
ncbi:MAG: type II toxin-antitoxin system VapC family toxin [Planctomycetota bacterium]|nr:type II toxin-antitoxin system VapC family toxin [Planctomycetota bacterium]